MSDNNTVSIDDIDLLDKDITEIADLAGFDVPVNGEYVLGFSIDLKKVNGKNSVCPQYRVISCVKQDSEEDTPTPAETKFGQLFMLEGEKADTALSALKPLLAPIGEAIGKGKVSEIIKYVQEQGEIIVGATVKRRYDKEDKEKIYANVKNLRMQ
jgi:hypothetical protein